jgi:pyrimidine-specific ribonucleoside hydrolase
MNGPSRRPRVLIDTDPGVDDLVALALAARSPELDLVAVTTTYGNATLAATTRNAREVLRLAGRSDVPVLPGADKPTRRTARTAPVRHGPEGAGDAPVPPLASVNPAATVIAHVLAAETEPVTVVTLGPLTNLAAAVEASPDLVPTRIARHVGMFGNVGSPLDAERRADFNAWCDPEAVDRVLRRRLPTIMVPLDASRRMAVPAQQVERARRSGDALASWLGTALSCALRYDRERRGVQGVLVHDALTVGAIIDPEVLELRDMRLTVSLDEGDDRGHTREAPDGVTTSVAVGVDVGRMMALLERVLT